MKTHSDSSNSIIIWKCCSCCWPSKCIHNLALLTSSCFISLGVLNVNKHWMFTAIFIFSIPLLTAVVGFYFMHSCLCQNQSFLITVGFCFLSPKGFIDVFYISSSAREMTSVESQHERGGIIRRIKGIFTSWPQSFFCFLRNAAITMCIVELPHVLWANQVPAEGTVGLFLTLGLRISAAKNVCWQTCFQILYSTAVSLLGVSVSSCCGETFVSPHLRPT